MKYDKQKALDIFARQQSELNKMVCYISIATIVIMAVSCVCIEDFLNIRVVLPFWSFLAPLAIPAGCWGILTTAIWIFERYILWYIASEEAKEKREELA